ncbi:MAG TPA: pentapeptide repeat-containing protein [Blastocatellia bacterium]|nr:pentapeptide repeat-containing protein [Blastocatellia bacterium]
MANPEHLEILKQGVEKWNQWRKGKPGLLPDLGEADLSGANLSGANLFRSEFRRARLGGADLSGADLRAANLRGADLSGANLRGANLKWGILSQANLSNVNLSEARLDRTVLEGADLSTAQGLTWEQMAGRAKSVFIDETTQLPSEITNSYQKEIEAIVKQALIQRSLR